MELEGGTQGNCNRCLEVGAESEGPYLSSIALLMLVMVWMPGRREPEPPE